jgi:Ca-activated chloride channel family protein
MMLTRYATLVLLCASATAAFAQKSQMPPPPRLIASDPGSDPIEVRELSISAGISGGMAETTVKMVFFNPNRRQLEGNVQFPLADGQQITAFALDIDGVLRPAVPVDKARGRQVFEEIQRRQVDPGLLEVTQGNNFKLRVYPIAPRGTRTVELKYSEVLQRRGANWVYRLPGAYGDARNVDVTVQVNDASAPVGGALQFERRDNGYQASLSSKQARLPAEGIEVLTAAHPEPRVYRQVLGDTSWFVAEVPVQSVRTARPAPRVIGLLWDSSGSGANRAHDAELAELDRYFGALSNVEVRLTRLRDRPEAQQVFKVEGGNWRALRSALERTLYDGASAINDWQPQAAVNQYLLFSDGLANYGGKRFPELAAHQQLFALNSSPSTDSGRLAALAERARGQLIEVNPATPGAAAQALLFQEALIEQVTASGARDLEVDSHMVRNGMLRVAGRMTAAQGELVLTLSNGGKQQRISVPIAANAAQHPNAAATWASFRLRALEAEFEAHRSEIGRIGRQFSIPTRETSLIVLEQISDYVRYDIEPPAIHAAEYRRLKGMRANEQSQARRSHFQQVVQMFEQRKAWWNTTFRDVPRKQRPAKGQRIRANETGSAAAFAETPRPVAPPVAMAAPPAAPSPVEMRAPAADMAADAKFKVESLQRAQVSRAETAGYSGGRRQAGAPAVEPQAAAAAPQIGMALKKWVPNAPYIERLNAAARDKVYQVYLDQKPDYANSSAFYLDAADILLAKGQRDLALRVLSNLAEMDLENRAVLRILGYRLLQAGAPALAVPVFEEVLRIAVEEPQSFRDLGLALAADGRAQEAVNKLYEVALRPWADRFPDIETIALADMNALIATSGKQLDLSAIDKRLLAPLPVDLRIVLTWDADNTDIDLHVTDPNGEECFFSNPRTSQGGMMSRDFTGGYGPEEFVLRRAKPGKYSISANFYGNRQQVLAGATTLQVKLFSGFGTAAQKEKLITLRLKDSNDTVFVGEIDVKP